MTQIPQLDTPHRVGRKPIKLDTIMKQVTLWLDPGDMARVQAFVGKQKGSEYVRAAINEKLERDKVIPYDPVTMTKSEKSK